MVQSTVLLESVKKKEDRVGYLWRLAVARYKVIATVTLSPRLSA